MAVTNALELEIDQSFAATIAESGNTANCASYREEDKTTPVTNNFSYEEEDIACVAAPSISALGSESGAVMAYELGWATVGKCEVLANLQIVDQKEITHGLEGLWGDGVSSFLYPEDNKTILAISTLTTSDCGDEAGPWITGLAYTQDGTTWEQVGGGDSHTETIHGDVVGFGGHVGGIYDALYWRYQEVPIPCSATVSFSVSNIASDPSDPSDPYATADGTHLRQSVFQEKIGAIDFSGAAGEVTMDFTSCDWPMDYSWTASESYVVDEDCSVDYECGETLFCSRDDGLTC